MDTHGLDGDAELSCNVGAKSIRSRVEFRTAGLDTCSRIGWSGLWGDSCCSRGDERFCHWSATVPNTVGLAILEQGADVVTIPRLEL